MRGLRTEPTTERVIYLPHWWTKSEIRVFSEASVPRRTVDLIVDAIAERTREVLPALKFDFRLLGNHESSARQVAASLVNGEIDEMKLFSLALSENWRDESRGGRQHGDIYITTKPPIGDAVSWAASTFQHGAMLFCLTGDRVNSREFLRKVTLHETGHLMGQYSHCDEYKNVAGFTYTEACNMHYACTYAELCKKCRTHFLWWWRGVLDEVEAQSAGT